MGGVSHEQMAVGLFNSDHSFGYWLDAKYLHVVWGGEFMRAILFYRPSVYTTTTVKICHF